MVEVNRSKGTLLLFVGNVGREDPYNISVFLAQERQQRLLKQPLEEHLQDAFYART